MTRSRPRVDALDRWSARVPGDPSLGGVPDRRRAARAGLARCVIDDVGAQLDPHRLHPDRQADGRGRRRRSRAARGAADPSEPVGDLDVAHGPLEGTWSRPTRCRWRSTSSRSSRCSAASPRARRSSAAPASCGSRSPTGSRPWSTACAASARDIEATDDGFVVHGGGGLRGGRIDAHGDHRLAMLGAVAGLASPDGVEVVGMEAAAVSYPGFEADLAQALLRMIVAIDGPAGAGKSTVARAVAARSASPTSTAARCTARSRCRAARDGRPPAAIARDAADRARRPRVARRRGRERRRSARPRSRRRRRGSRPTRGARGAGGPAARAARGGRLGRRGARHRHRRRPRTPS